VYKEFMTQLRHLVILNPVAAKGAAGERRAELEGLLKARSIDYDLALTSGVWHAAELARDAGRQGYSIIVASGGDGTMNEVINGLMLASARGERLPAMAVLAMGRGNDFAYGADVPGTLAAGVDTIAAGQTRAMDVGLIKGGNYPQGRYFGNGVGIGFDTIVGLEAAKLKHVQGFMAYVIGALKTFISYPEAPFVRLTHEGGVIEQYSHQISIMNGKRMGGTFFMAPGALNHDGLLDLCLAARMNRREMATAIMHYTKGTQAELPFITTGRSAHYAVEAPKGGLYVHADGETICENGSAVQVECLPSLISLLCNVDHD
jgi:YegS/Rv2252/BmrU family lipid kinase